ncbi:MAG: VWA domain-containing protein [Hyphomonas sp.]|nr:VWA domain-containing protein [Hyphomonas sp.]MCB9962329.1 VWA domain-containing protein [Hyphomonas sp.]MCB9972840.1 VWA domain-containing protein [Hyphomonas sp.]
MFRFSKAGADERGSTATMWALMMLPIMVIAAAALDFSNRETVERELKAAADMAAIAGVRHGMTTGAKAKEVREVAIQNFDQNLPAVRQGVGIVPIVNVKKDDSVTVTAKYAMPTSMLALAGISKLEVKVKSKAVYQAPAKIEAVLVLDNSWSMDGTRMTALRSAANTFVSTVVTNNDDTVRVGVVPFNNFVNVGLSNKTASWINVPPSYTGDGWGCTVDEPASKALGCSKTTSTCYNDGDPYSCDQWTCPSGKSLVQSCPKVTYSWYGCVRSRTPPLDIEDRNYVSEKVPGHLTENDWGCPSAILPMTSSVSKLNAAISAMKAESETYIATGLSWGHRVLSEGKPFDDGISYDEMNTTAARKILVLMSDGENTRSRSSWDGNHWDQDRVAADATTKAACTDIKKDGIEVFTIAFGIEDADTVAMLKSCATDSTYFFNADNPSALIAAFKSIGSEFQDIALAE